MASPTGLPRGKRPRQVPGLKRASWFPAAEFCGILSVVEPESERAACSVCHGPVRPGNRTGICTLNAGCEREQKRVRRAAERAARQAEAERVRLAEAQILQWIREIQG